MESVHVTLTLIAAGAALSGALGAQFIASVASHRMKRMELGFIRKADAYLHLAGAIGQFTFQPGELSEYVGFLGASEQAKLVASDDVIEAVDALLGAAQRLRSAPPEQRGDPGWIRFWVREIHGVSDAMRRDLRLTCPRAPR